MLENEILVRDGKPGAFCLLAGETELTDYQFDTRRIHHLFFRHSDLHSFAWGESAESGGKVCTVNPGCLTRRT